MIAVVKRIRRWERKAERQHARRLIRQSLEQHALDCVEDLRELAFMEAEFMDDDYDFWPYDPAPRLDWQKQYEKEYYEWVDAMEEEFECEEWDDEPDWGEEDDFSMMADLVGEEMQ